MNTGKICAVAACLATVAATSAQTNTIVEWSGADPNAYTIYQPQATITIDNPGGHTFKFYAHDGSGTPGTGIINNITLDDPNTATGDFSLMIADPNDPNKAGVLHWKTDSLLR